MYLRAKRNWGVFVFLLALALLVPFFMNCGGGGGFSDPQSSSASTQVMVTPEQVNAWVTNGYGTDSHGYNKLVILDVASQANYGGSTKGHVPGAFLVENNTTDLYTSRSDGIGGNYSYTDTGSVTWTDTNTPSMIATKAQMDAIIQRTGIDGNTVVLITGDSMMEIGRLYFNFRYWGFPKNRLRVMNGSNATYTAAGFTLETTVPAAPTPSTYSVCNLTQDTSVRAPLAEMIQVAEDTDAATIVVDSRTPNEYNGVAGSTAGPFSGKAGYAKKVAFEGHVKTAVNQNYVGLLEGGSTSNPLIPDADIRTAMEGLGLSAHTTAYTYCRTSWRAAVTFLALDAVLGWPVKIYDGAWMEWGQMADKAKTGALEANSPWRTDNAARSESVTYNVDNAFTVDPISSANSYSTRADQVNVTDGAICGTGGGGGGGGAPGY